MPVEFFFITFDADLLWTAPELLRDSLRLASASSDIYSFGIILQEIVNRTGAFESSNVHFSPEGILLK